MFELAILLAAAYPLILLATNVLAKGPRKRLFSLAEELRKDSRSNSDDRDHLDHLMDSYISFKVTMFLIPMTLLFMSWEKIVSKKPFTRNSWLVNEERYHQLVRDYVLSIFAVNPLALPFSLAALIIFSIISLIVDFRVSIETVEESVTRAADQMSIPASA
jgi:hypothetical protein